MHLYYYLSFILIISLDHNLPTVTDDDALVACCHLLASEVVHPIVVHSLMMVQCSWLDTSTDRPYRTEGEVSGLIVLGGIVGFQIFACTNVLHRPAFTLLILTVPYGTVG